MNATQRSSFRKAVADAVSAEVARVRKRGANGIVTVAAMLREDEASVRRWSSGATWPAVTTCERIAPMLGVKVPS